MKNKEILDNQMDLDVSGKVFGSRFSRNIIVFVGVVFTILGVLILLVTVYDIYRTLKALAESTVFSRYFSLGYWLLAKSLFFLYIVGFLLGGIGLLMRDKIGWIFTFATALFVVVNIGVNTYLINSNTSVGIGYYGWILIGVAIFFALIVVILLSKNVRDYFNPTLKSFGIAGSVIVLFSILFTLIIVLA